MMKIFKWLPGGANSLSITSLKPGIWLGILFMTLFCSCEKDYPMSVPGNGETAYINFFHSGEAFYYLTTPRTADPMIYINDSVPTDIFPAYPQFYLTNVHGDFQGQYPRHFTGTDKVIDNASGQGEMFWMPLKAGQYKFIHTSPSVSAYYIHEEQVELEPNTYYASFLTESPEHDAAYTSVTAALPRQASEGHVGVLIVHLSPDLGSLDLFRMDNAGNKLPSSLPKNFEFARHSYVELPATGAGSERAIIKISRAGSENAVLLTGIPDVNKAVFVLAIRGFASLTPRRIKDGENKYLTAEVLPNLRVKLRRAFF